MPTYLDLKKGLAPGDNIAIRIGENIKFFRILNRDVILWKQELDAISAGSAMSFTEVTELNPPDDELYQVFRFDLLEGNVQVQFKQPSSTNRLGLERSPEGGFVTDRNDEAVQDFWVLEDFPPSIQVTNGTNVSITPKFMWWGWRYLIRHLPQKPDAFTLVNVGGIAR